MSAHRPTPETDAKQYDLLHADTYTSWQETLKHARTLERQRDEAMELCDFNAKQLLVAVNERNSLVVQRDRLLEALIGVLEEWEGGYRPEDCGTTMAIAREAIAEVEGSR